MGDFYQADVLIKESTCHSCDAKLPRFEVVFMKLIGRGVSLTTCRECFEVAMQIAVLEAKELATRHFVTKA